MIVPMRKVTLLLSARQRTEALKKLRRLGVLHVANVQPPKHESIQSLQDELAEIDRGLELLPPGVPESIPESARERLDDEPLQIARMIDGYDQSRANLASELAEYRDIRSWYDRWGPVSHDDIEILRRAGILVRLYVADKRSLKFLPPEAQIQIVRQEAGTVYFALFCEDPGHKLPFKEQLVPRIEMADLDRLIARLEEQIAEVDELIAGLAAARDKLAAHRADLLQRLEMQEVLHGMGAEERFVWLQGFCPARIVPQLTAAAEENGWAWIVAEPDPDDDAPTLVENPKWLRIVQPLFDFLGTLPGYREFDISFPFLLFFSLFFAMIVSDAGYGLVFVVAAFIASRKAGPEAPKEAFFLVYVLGGATMLWGLLSGNWFGYEDIGRLPFFNWALIDSIDAFSDTNQNTLMYLCFLIAVIHLSVAHALRAWRQINTLKAIAELGWIAIIWTLFFVAGQLVLGEGYEAPTFTGLLFAGGSAAILLFANFRKNILTGILITLGDLPLSIISSFSDVVSYLRLFAVGYASVIVAASFNDMALAGGISGPVAGLGAALILLLGHSLNIVLCLMGVIVHGVRLNLLEFSGQLGMQWSGREYRPFSE